MTQEHDWRQNPQVDDQKYCVRCTVVVHVPNDRNQRLQPLYRRADKKYTLDEPACEPKENR